MKSINMKIDCLSDFKFDKKSGGFFSKLFGKSTEEKIKFIKIKSGVSPTIITISGFNTEGLHNFESWKASINSIYPENEWYHLEWPSKNLNLFSPKWDHFAENLFEKEDEYIYNVKDFTKVISLQTETTFINFFLPTLLSLSPTLLLIVLGSSIGRGWFFALKNCRASATLLLNAITQYEKETIIFGHSLGARMIFYLLRGCAEYDIDFKIQECHLMGGAIDNSKSNWIKVNRLVPGGIFNYYSKNDEILKKMYPVGTFKRNPIGRKPIEIPNVQNFDVSDLVDGHSDYFRNLLYYFKREY